MRRKKGSMVPLEVSILDQAYGPDGIAGYEQKLALMTYDAWIGWREDAYG